MNSVEAGATEIDLIFLAEKSQDKDNPNPAFLSIYDDGIGIQTKDELVKHFETFGQPHEENENVVWKQFRMGRGQMFAFGKNTWRTSEFKMLVDVDNMELDYELQDGLEQVAGCKIDIELYKNPLDNYTINSVKSFKEEVKEQVRYVKIPVKFNDEVVSIDPSILNWDHEDEYAYYKFSETSQLKIYNLGVFVMSRSIRNAGVGGVVVSKSMLKVNFARNDVDSTCPIYQGINKIVLENKIKKANKQYKALTSDDRYSLLSGLRDAEEGSYQYEGKRILPLTNGKWITWKMFIKDSMTWCFAPAGNRIADKHMQGDKAICFDEMMIEEMGYDGPLDEFFDWLWADILAQSYSKDYRLEQLEQVKNQFVMFDKSQVDSVSKEVSTTTLSDSFSESYSYIPYSKLKKTEKRIVDVLTGISCWDDRQIRIGLSTVASAWTDGSSYIALERSWLRNISLTYVGSVLDLFTTMCHEMAHDSTSAGTHNHGPEFYENYYEITRSSHWENPLTSVYKFSEKMDKMRINEKQNQEMAKELELSTSLGTSDVAASM